MSLTSGDVVSTYVRSEDRDVPAASDGSVRLKKQQYRMLIVKALSLLYGNSIGSGYRRVRTCGDDVIVLMRSHANGKWRKEHTLPISTEGFDASAFRGSAKGPVVDYLERQTGIKDQSEEARRNS